MIDSTILVLSIAGALSGIVGLAVFHVSQHLRYVRQRHALQLDQLQMMLDHANSKLNKGK